MDDDLLDMDVLIDDPIHGAFYNVSSLSPFDGDERTSASNPLSLTVWEEI